MSHSFTLPESAKLVDALPPAADAAGRSSAYYSLKNGHKAYFLVEVNQGAANTVALTIQQATNVAGAGSKAIATARIWANQDFATSDALARQADGASFTTSAAVARKLVVIEIDPAALDVAGGFDCVRITTGASIATNITAAQLVLTPLRYSADVPPSVIVD